jgi:rubrerythrin
LVGRAEEKLNAFMELELVTQMHAADFVKLGDAEKEDFYRCSKCGQIVGEIKFE